jgi:hypothetical protein
MGKLISRRKEKGLESEGKNKNERKRNRERQITTVHPFLLNLWIQLGLEPTSLLDILNMNKCVLFVSLLKPVIICNELSK